MSGNLPEADTTSVGPELARAWAAALDAAGRSGVRLRELEEVTELREAAGLVDRIWGSSSLRSDPPVTTVGLRALAHAGNYVTGAYEGDRLVGLAVAFFAAPAEASLHSHLTGVSDEVQGRGVGFALKLHQRAWAMARGVRTVTWTFDPLVQRNAAFNLSKLAASAAAYLPDFYGRMPDAINAGSASDRLLVSWPLADPAVVAAAEGRSWLVDTESAGVAPVLDVGLDGGPVVEPAVADVVAVRVPRDIAELRRARPDLARVWRSAVRDTVGRHLRDGGQVLGLDADLRYVIRVGRR